MVSTIRRYRYILCVWTTFNLYKYLACVQDEEIIFSKTVRHIFFIASNSHRYR